MTLIERLIFDGSREKDRVWLIERDRERTASDSLLEKERVAVSVFECRERDGEGDQNDDAVAVCDSRFVNVCLVGECLEMLSDRLNEDDCDDRLSKVSELDGE